MKSSSEHLPNSAREHDPKLTRSPSAELADVIRQLRGLQNVTSPSQPLDQEGREYVSDQIGRLAEELERLALGILLSHGVFQGLLALA